MFYVCCGTIFTLLDVGQMIVTFQTQDQAQNENWSPRRLASLIAKRQSRYVKFGITFSQMSTFALLTRLCSQLLSGEDAKYLIAPLPIDIKSDEGSDQSHTATHNHSKKKPPKNFFKANRQALKEVRCCLPLQNHRSVNRRAFTFILSL